MALSANGPEEFRRRDNRHPLVGAEPPEIAIPRYNEMRAAFTGTFEDAIIIRVRSNQVHHLCGGDDHRHADHELEPTTEPALLPVKIFAQDLGDFPENSWGDEELIPAGEGGTPDPCGHAARVPKGGHIHVRVKDDAQSGGVAGRRRAGAGGRGG